MAQGHSLMPGLGFLDLTSPPFLAVQQLRPIVPQLASCLGKCSVTELLTPLPVCSITRAVLELTMELRMTLNSPVAKDDLKCLILLLPPPEIWDHRQVPHAWLFIIF